MLDDLRNVLGKYYASYGLNDETLMLSQFIDKFIVMEQKNRLEIKDVSSSN